MPGFSIIEVIMKLLRIFILLLFSTPLWASYPPNTIWSSIKTEHFNIIFDSSIQNDAQSIANKLENYYLSITDGMGGNIDRYTIVLPAEMIDSNGYVSSVNNKSVFYPTAPTESFAGTLEWYDLLTFHETRHMTQFTEVRDAFSQKILEFLFGSYGIVSAFLIPSYFYEGDAVLTETLLSNSGRGRSPGFERALRTILLSDKNYSFAKAFHRSDRDYYPNQYALGYYLMTYLEREYGKDILSEILGAAANNPLPMNFSTAALFVTGEGIPTVYKNTTSELRTLWQKQDDQVVTTNITLVSEPDTTYFTSMYYPEIDENETLYYIESGLHISSRLVIEKHGEREVIDEITGDFSINGSNILYTVESSDPRWTYRGYSDVSIYDQNSRKHKRLTKKERYFNPVFSSDGSKIVTVELSTERMASLVIIDTENGEVINTKRFDNADVLSGFSWNEDDSQIVFSVLKGSGSGLALYDLDKDDVKYISSINNVEKSFPQFYKDSIIFVSSYSGIDNINAIDLDTLNEFQVVSSRFGANYPFVIDDKLLFSDYTLAGYRVYDITLNREKWINIEDVKQLHVDYFEPLLSDVIKPLEERIIYETNDYNPNTHLIDIHSWLLNPVLPVLDKSDVYNLYLDDYFDVTELVLYSSDYLEYLDSTFYAHYNNRSEAWDIGGFGSYSGFYPYIEWDLNLYSESFYSGLSNIDLTLNMQLPLIFTNDSFYIGVMPDYQHGFDSESSLGATYYVAYIYTDNNLYFEPLASFNQGLINDPSLSLGFSTELDIVGFFERDLFTINNELDWGINEESLVYGSQVSKPDSSILDFDQFTSRYFIYNYLEYDLPIFYPDLSIFNWIFFNAVDLYATYESVYSEATDYDQLVSSRLSFSYYLLRSPVTFNTDFTLYYDISADEIDYTFTPISFSYNDL